MFIALAVLVIWLLIPTLKVIIYMFVGTKTERPNFIRSTLVLGSIAVLCSLSYHQFTWQEKIQSPGVIVYKDSEVARSYCPGFVEKVHVNTGDYVEKDQPLITLQNREKQVALAEIKYDIAITENFIRRHRDDDSKRIQVQIAKEKLQYFNQTLREQKKLINSLVIRSPINGYIFNEDLLSLFGRFVNTGEDLVEVSAPESAVFRAAILEDDIEQYAIKQGIDVSVYVVSSQTSFAGKVASISPRADYEIKHPGITALAGGDLIVEQSPVAKQKQGTQYRLAYPHFYLEVTIPPHLRKSLRNEQTGYIRIYREKKTIAELLYYKIKSKIQKFYAENL